MDSETRVSSILDRLMGVGWFFTCIFGANAALGVCLELLGSPAATQLQLGFLGGMGALVGMGALTLARAFLEDNLSTLQRVTLGSVFVTCLCGAGVALGTYLFAIQGRTGLGSFLSYSLLAGATALFVTGSLKLGETYAASTSADAER